MYDFMESPRGYFLMYDFNFDPLPHLLSYYFHQKNKLFDYSFPKLLEVFLLVIFRRIFLHMYVWKWTPSPSSDPFFYILEPCILTRDWTLGSNVTYLFISFAGQSAMSLWNQQELICLAFEARRRNI